MGNVMAPLGKVFATGTHNVVTATGETIKDVTSNLTYVPVGTATANLKTLIPDADIGDFAATLGLAYIWQWDGTEWLEV